MIQDPLRSCKTYIEAQFRGIRSRAADAKAPFVTISRQAGAGGITIGRLLARYLNERDGKNAPAWTVFDKNLVAEVLKTYNLPEKCQEFMNEDKISEIDDILAELFRLHPAKWTLVQKTTRTILHLSQLGHAILVGRGANVITRKLHGGFHVRLVGSMTRRLRHLQEYYGFNSKQAADFIKSEDKGRKDYLKTYFDRNIDDPLLYDIIINTDFVSAEEAAHIIGRAVLSRKHGDESCLEESAVDSFAEGPSR